MRTLSRPSRRALPGLGRGGSPATGSCSFAARQGRHGPGHALFIYLRDPDGHCIELFNTHYQVMDRNEPVRWNVSDAAQRRWQLPARRQWFLDASRFAGVDPRDPDRSGAPRALEDFLPVGMR